MNKRERGGRTGFKVTKLQNCAASIRKCCVCVRAVEVWHSVLCEMWMPVLKEKKEKRMSLIFPSTLARLCWESFAHSCLWSEGNRGTGSWNMDKKDDGENREKEKTSLFPFFFPLYSYSKWLFPTITLREKGPPLQPNVFWNISRYISSPKPVSSLIFFWRKI